MHGQNHIKIPAKVGWKDKWVRGTIQWPLG